MGDRHRENSTRLPGDEKNVQVMVRTQQYCSSGSRFTAPGADYVPKLVESAQLPLSIHPHAAMPVVRVGADKQGRTAHRGTVVQ